MSFSIDRTLYDGAPADLSGRSEVEQDSYRLLQKLQIPFARVDHDPADTIEDCKLVEAVIGVHICKNLFLQNRQGTQFYLLLMAGDKPFRTSVVSKLIGTSRLSFGTPEKMQEFLHVTPGSVSILGLMYDEKRRVELLIDRDIFEAEFLRCHPCKNTSTLRIAVSDVRRILLPYTGHKPRVLTLPSTTDAES